MIIFSTWRSFGRSGFVRFITRGLAPALLVVWVMAAGFLQAAQEPVRFNRDIKPILADNCLACHGPDGGARKAGLRLDTRPGLFEATDKRAAPVVPGSPDTSELWRRIVTQNEDDLMPPAASHKVVSAGQKELIRRWIEEGASWQGHWSFERPERPVVPAVSQPDWVRTPVDAFVLAGLEARGLRPAPEADRRVLLRRLALDLTGLPPGPEEVEAFVRDHRPDAYERQVERMLALPAYGEHRARYWLDAVRYADTHGLHFDNRREIWPYRDWVVRAFNRNLPFDQFVVEQLAGDLLEGATDEQVVATGMQRCNMSTNEGGTIEEENLVNYANDRVSTTGWVFLGLTLNCAACHDHKFDPITMKDFYSLAAFYRNTKEGGYDHNWAEGDQYEVVPQTAADRVRWQQLKGELEAAKRRLEREAAAADRGFTNWVREARGLRQRPAGMLSEEHLRLPLDEGRGSNVLGMVSGRKERFEFQGPLEWRGGVQGPGLSLLSTNGLELGHAGDVDSGQPFSVAAWVWVPEGNKNGGAILARLDGEGEGQRGWEFFLREDTFGLRLVRDTRSEVLVVRGPEKVLKGGRWQHVAATYDGTMRGSGVRLLVDGAEVEATKEADRLEVSVRADVPLRLGRREQGGALTGVGLQDVRMYLRRLEAGEVALLAVGPRLPEMLGQVEFQATNNAAREAVRLYHRASTHRGWRAAAARLHRLEDERTGIRLRSPVTLVMREKTNAPVAHVLFRGQYDQRREEVAAGTPSVLPPLPAGVPRNRLGLARWLVGPENPLTARVTVNRYWQELFGTGLVNTPEDFGMMGERPVNPELLDWLAVEFRESGWDVKRLMRLLVTSAAYRQGAVVGPEVWAADPGNRLLSRGPRFRMDGEMVRDYALAASGLLSRKVGGPSVRPYQPGGVWEAVAMPESNTRRYGQSRGEDLYRRSLYTFWKRAAPPASLEILNAPSRETCTVRRERTDTPLQALVTLNDPQFVEAARCLAARAWNEGGGRREQVLGALAGRVLCRPLKAGEREVVGAMLDAMLEYYRGHAGAAEGLLAVGDMPADDRVPGVELAAWTLVANQLLNLDEVLNK